MDDRKQIFTLLVDVETTGLNPNYHEIIEISALLLDEKFKLLGEFNSLVKPRKPWRGVQNNFDVYEYTGISRKELKKAPTLKKVLYELDNFLDDHLYDLDKDDYKIVICGQNSKFDFAFIEQAYYKAIKKFPFDYHVFSLESIFCTYFLCKEGFVPNKLSLKAICEYLKIDRNNSLCHRASYDTQLTLKCLNKIFRELRSSIFGGVNYQ